MPAYFSPPTETTRCTARGLLLLVWICLWERQCGPLQVFGFTTSPIRSLSPASLAADKSLTIQQREKPIFTTNDDEESSSPNTSVDSIQQRLVQYGLAWKQAPLEKVSADNSFTRVPGCVATVYVRATLNDKNGKDSTITENAPNINIIGHSDAIVSRGLMAILAEYLQRPSMALEQILELDPAQVADLLGVRPALSPGRNDGLANMVEVIQQQLQENSNSEDGSKVSKDFPGTARDSDVDSIGKRPTVALLLSGGVDSSVALRLLQQDGYDVTAFYLKIWLEDELAHLGECPWEDDVHICQQVCDQAGVPLKIMSLQEEYHQRVMQHTLNEASQGRTPNPDILCNSRVKFGCFLDSIDENDYDYVASGHYAQLIRPTPPGPSTEGTDLASDQSVKLVRAPDPIKDQSYFLCALKQSQLQRLLFPIGHLEKSQVRALAEEFELPNRHRPDSQGLCFLGKVKFRDFLEIHLGQQPGKIVDAFSGEVIGQHDGVWYHTVGQRKGIGKSLFPLATAKGPWYVVAKDPADNLVFASNQYDEEVFAQARSEFHVENIHWITGRPPSASSNEGESSQDLRLWLKIRHGPRLVRGTLQLTSVDGAKEDNGEGIIRLEAKDGGLAPGQYAVFYNEEAECLGMGIISERHWARFLLDTQSRTTQPQDGNTTRELDASAK